MLELSPSIDWESSMVYPLVQEMAYQDPLHYFALFAGQQGALFLDSAQTDKACGRYSFIAVDPFLTLVSKNGHNTLAGAQHDGDPFALLVKSLALYPLKTHADLPPFQGGVAGFFGYDLCHHLEKLPTAREDDKQFPDMALGFYDLVMSFDHVQQRAWIFSSGYPLAENRGRLQHAQTRLDTLLSQLQSATDVTVSLPEKKLSAVIETNFTPQSYQAAVRKVQDYILAGDIFEANISQRFTATLPDAVSAFQLYCHLRARNPAPFAAYLYLADTVIASASPERFLKLTGRAVEARPIKGTCPRGATPDADHALATALLQSEKDRAENIMIVDLLRNDLSRVCVDHSVQVPQLCGLESYATVHHLVSVITGQLRPAYHAVDLLRATFPGGSITGAPKIRAMEIIAEIEPTARGPYCGSVGYIGFDGNMDCSIVIRTYAIQHKLVTFQAGGAVVADSDPLGEYEEVLLKSRVLREVLSSWC